MSTKRVRRIVGEYLRAQRSKVTITETGDPATRPAIVIGTNPPVPAYRGDPRGLFGYPDYREYLLPGELVRPRLDVIKREPLRRGWW